MIGIALIFSVGYLLLLGWFALGWLRLKETVRVKADSFIRFSIIVPARNEERNIVKTINDLVSQKYPADFFEVIIVDDDSDDQTYQLAQQRITEISRNGCSIRLIKSDTTGDIASGHKKIAIETGIRHSKHDWIITTDADCIRGYNWLSAFSDIIIRQNPVFVSAPVCFYGENSLFQKMQSLEFMSLVGMGAASIANGSPNLCNGANLAYQKSAFNTVGGFSGNLQLSSGDDEFLLHKISAAYPGSISFLKSRDAFVFTRPVKNLKDFIRQRKRWVSKSTKYQKKQVFALLLFVYLFHFLILLAGILTLFSMLFIKLFFILFISKVLSEMLLVLPLSIFNGKSKYLPIYPLAAICYVVYVVSIGFIGNSGSYVWKGRKVK
jgi:cellulose synthase/poly-beta-1,6-N-acetylglucosamine synthase-like glycosyltransferase